jgi:hypothetical protein
LKIISNINKAIFLFVSASAIIFIISGCADRNLPENGVRLIDLIEPVDSSMVVNFPIEDNLRRHTLLVLIFSRMGLLFVIEIGE